MLFYIAFFAVLFLALWIMFSVVKFSVKQIYRFLKWTFSK